MARRPLIRRGCLVVLLLAAWASPAAAQYDVSGAPRRNAPLTILQINDVYSTVPVDGRGGLARVATVKQQIADAGGQPLLMLAGDFLSSSVSSTVFQGEQMVATLNAAGLDIATLGNHEFDFGIDVLLARMAEARWTWVIANVVDRQTGRIVGDAEPYVVREFGTLRVAVLGLCIADDVVTNAVLDRVEVLDPIETAGRYLPEIRAEDVDLIVALTHLSYATDRALAERFPEIDIILGGHEHYPITAFVGHTLISKSGTEARHIARIDVLGHGPAVERHFELLAIDESVPEDAATARVAHEYESRLDAALDEPIATLTVALDGIGANLRTSETNLGNLAADAVRAAVNADIGLVNGGGLRGDRAYPPGPFTRRHVLEIHPFGNVVCLAEMSGRVLISALEYGLRMLPLATGGFLHVSGLRIRVDPSLPAGSRVREAEVNGAPLDPDRTYAVALPSFLLEGGDGFDTFGDVRIVIGPETGPTLATSIERFVAGRELAPATEGRIELR